MIDELDYYIETQWRSAEFPHVGDFLSIIDLCSDEDKKMFEKMTTPEYLHVDFQNTLEYLRYYRWKAVERSWVSDEAIQINCRKVDPTY